MPRMLRQFFYFAFMLGVLVLGSHLSATADPPSPYLPGEVILKFKSTATQNDMNQVYSELGGTKVKGLGRIKAELRRINTMSVEDAVTRYRNHPKIEYLEPNYIVEAVEIPNDPMFPQLYGM
ncbi:MAG TPA: hypothetical protein VFP10_07210, partial [Candidatus Eisenbacteria bacterium]|nr:hypothetical protein [Candidatus Eisenbacteria bacterium]